MRCTSRSMMSAACSTCSSEMTSGGASRMMSPCVGFASRPAPISAWQSAPASFAPSGRTTTALSSPRPRTAAMAGESMASRRARRRSPMAAAFSASFSSRKTLSAAMATAHPSGLPPYVEPCSPGRMVSITSCEERTAETGYTPPERALPSTSRSGFTSSWSTASMRPVRQSPVCTSSAIISTRCLVHSSRTPRRYPAGGTTTPASPWMGSNMKPHTFGLAVSAASSACRSPYGTRSMWLMKGPKPLRQLGSLDDEQAESERPQKLPSQKSTVASFSGTPLTSYPHRRASLMAVSPPSTPVFMGSTRSKPKKSVTNSVYSPSTELWKARDVSVSLAACEWSASRIAGWAWPWLTAE
mmetsp:Transcript_47258/g.156665  ORF Transcript_47258/g.156665 Transcript_47258/m.156665 type:complete len:356 (+) Transcript_47258:303-1370(+)